MPENPKVKIEIFEKPNGGMAVVCQPTVKEMMTLESQGKWSPAFGAAMFMLSLVMAAEKKGRTRTNLWLPPGAKR